MGAWLATLAALKRPNNVQSLLLIAAAPDFTQRLIEPQLDHGQQWDLQQGSIIRRPSQYGGDQPLSQALLDSGRRLSLFDRHDLEQLSCPVRLLHGTEDSDVPFSLSVELLQRLKQADAQLTLINEADHRLSDDRCVSLITSVLLQLIEQLPE